MISRNSKLTCIRRSITFSDLLPWRSLKAINIFKKMTTLHNFPIPLQFISFTYPVPHLNNGKIQFVPVFPITTTNQHHPVLSAPFRIGSLFLYTSKNAAVVYIPHHMNPSDCRGTARGGHISALRNWQMRAKTLAQKYRRNGHAMCHRQKITAPTISRRNAWFRVMTWSKCDCNFLGWIGGITAVACW